MPRLTQVITEGAADAFVNTAMATALNGITRTAYRLLELTAEMVVPALPMFPTGAAAVQDFELCLSRRTKAAMPVISDVDVIQKFVRASHFATAVGYGPVFDPVLKWTPPAASRILIVEDPLYLQLDSTATGQALSFVVTLDYEVVSITELDRLTLLTQSLT